MTSTNLGTKECDKEFAAAPLKVAAIASLLLSVLKFCAWWWTGSMIVLGSLLDSLADSVMSVVNHKLHALARTDADREHPFGHGGLEVIAGFIQGLVILFLAAALFSESVRKFSDDDGWLEEGTLLTGILIMICAAIGGWGIQAYLARAEKKMAQRSLSLKADRAHYAGDAAVNAVGALGLGCVWFFQLSMLDALFGGVGALLFAWTAKDILLPCIHDVMHKEVDPELQKDIVKVIQGHPQCRGVHKLRTRQLGPHLFLDFHMVLEASMSLQEAHQVSDDVTLALRKRWPDIDVVIHMDPNTEPPEEEWVPSWKELKTP
ncbi:MAG: cation diffusion facilitator family transporter [Oligoflexales bacterium]